MDKIMKNSILDDRKKLDRKNKTVFVNSFPPKEFYQKEIGKKIRTAGGQYRKFVVCGRTEKADRL